MISKARISAAALATLATCAALVAAAPAAAELQHFTATARDVQSGRVLYTEQYDVHVEDNRWVSGITRYLAPSGQQIAERRFDFAADRYLPVFSLDQTQPVYQEGITRIDRDKVEVYQVRDGERKTASLDRPKDLVADCGSQAYVADHMDELQAGKTLHFTLVVAGRVDSFRLRASKVKDAEVEGRRGVQIRIELDSMLSLVLPPIELTIDPVTKRILEYSGITTVKNPATHKSYVARIVFAYR
jgi:hypothetical protein